eukprot:2208573-Pleurochrysis_carterae.AAC.1
MAHKAIIISLQPDVDICAPVINVEALPLFGRSFWSLAKHGSSVDCQAAKKTAKSHLSSRVILCALGRMIHRERFAD